MKGSFSSRDHLGKHPKKTSMGIGLWKKKELEWAASHLDVLSGHWPLNDRYVGSKWNLSL